MAKYTLTKEPDKTNDFDLTTVSIEFEAEQIEQVFESFEDFLKGCGFSEATIEKHLNGN